MGFWRDRLTILTVMDCFIQALSNGFGADGFGYSDERASFIDLKKDDYQRNQCSSKINIKSKKCHLKKNYI